MPELILKSVTYHGGFSYVPESKWTRIGRLILGNDKVTMDRIQDKQMRNLPAIELCSTRAISAIEVTSEQTAKSKVGAAVLFGVLGAVTARGSMDRATLIVHLKSGEKGYFTMDKQSVASLLGIVEPWMREKGITSGSPEMSLVQTAAPNLIADELSKLAQLRDSGVLSEDEFSDLKSKLIEDHLRSP